MKDILDLYIKASELARIGIWEYDLQNNVLTWDQVTRSIHEVSEDFQPCIHKALSFYKEGVNRERITQDIDFVISNGGSFTNEYEIISQKGNHKYIISHSL